MSNTIIKRNDTIIVVILLVVFVSYLFVNNFFTKSLTQKGLEYYYYCKIFFLAVFWFCMLQYAIRTKRLKQYLIYSMIFFTVSLIVFFVFK